MSRIDWRRVVRFAFCCSVASWPVVAAAQFGGLGGEQAKPEPALAPANAVAPAKPLTPQQRVELASAMEQQFEKLEADFRKQSLDASDPQGVVEAVGRDPQKLLEWVRGNTLWVPYQGALRGPVGVVADRYGNSLDRALLLGDLLRTAGYRVRLAHATLDEAAANRLLSQSPAAPASAPPAASSDAPGAEMRKNVLAFATALEGAFLKGGAGAPAPGKEDDDRRQNLADARDHWWAQREETGKWVDLDPASAGATPAENFPFEGLAGTAKLPPKHVHELVVRIVIERWEAGGLSEKTPFQATLRPVELAGERLVLRHSPLNVPTTPPPAGNIPAVKKAALAEKEWLPVLTVGDRAMAHASFDDAGEINDKPNVGGAGKLAGRTGALLGGLGGGLGGGGGDAKGEEKQTILTAEWIDYEVRAPGRDPRKVRREIFDLIGPAARAGRKLGRPSFDETARLTRALTLAGMVDSLPLTFQPSLKFYAHRATREVLAARRNWLRALRDPDPTAGRKLAAAVNLPGPEYLAAVSRADLSPAAGRTYLHGVNLFNHMTHMLPGPGGTLVGREVMDLALNDVAAVPSAAGPEAFRARLRQGVADTAAEDLVLPGPDPSPQNALALFTRHGPTAGAAGLVRVDDPQAPALRQEAIPINARARIVAQLNEGYAVVLSDPVAPAAAGGAALSWWRVHPGTGEAVGVTESGFFSDITEEAFLENDTAIGQTFIRQRPNVPFWRQHYTHVIRQLGGDPADKALIDMVLDLQNQMLSAGIWL